MGRRAKPGARLRLAHPAEGVALGVAGLLVAATLTISLGGLPGLPGGSSSGAVVAGGAAGPSSSGTSPTSSATAAGDGSAAAAAAASAATAYSSMQVARLATVVQTLPPLSVPSGTGAVLPGVGVLEASRLTPLQLPVDAGPAPTASPTSASTAPAASTPPSTDPAPSGSPTGGGEAPSSAPSGTSASDGAGGGAAATDSPAGSPDPGLGLVAPPPSSTQDAVPTGAQDPQVTTLAARGSGSAAHSRGSDGPAGGPTQSGAAPDAAASPSSS